MSICFLFWICLKPCDQHLASYCKTVFKPNDCFMSSQVFVGFCFHICLTFASVNIPFKFHWFCIFSRLQCSIKKNGILATSLPMVAPSAQDHSYQNHHVTKFWRDSESNPKSHAQQSHQRRATCIKFWCNLGEASNLVIFLPITIYSRWASLE